MVQSSDRKFMLICLCSPSLTGVLNAYAPVGILRSRKKTLSETPMASVNRRNGLHGRCRSSFRRVVLEGDLQRLRPGRTSASDRCLLESGFHGFRDAVILQGSSKHLCCTCPSRVWATSVVGHFVVAVMSPLSAALSSMHL